MCPGVLNVMGARVAGKVEATASQEGRCGLRHHLSGARPAKMLRVVSMAPIAMWVGQRLMPNWRILILTLSLRHVVFGFV